MPEPAAEDGQLSLFTGVGAAGLPPLVPALPPLAEVPAPPLHRVRRLSFSALALFERCSYRYYAERAVGMRPTDERAAAPGTGGLAATEIGDAVHRLLELVNLQEPLPPDDLAARVRGWYPRGRDDELQRIPHFLERADAVVSTVFLQDQLPELEAELSAAIARINAGDFRPTPDEFICAGCPALDVVCAGPRLRSAVFAETFVAA